MCRPVGDFAKNATMHDGLQSMCRLCAREYRREYRERRPEALQRAARKYAQSERGRFMKRTSERAKRYGLTRKEMLELIAQPCAICAAPSEVIDHDHTSGKVRGALCRECNLGLGYFRDRPELLRAAAGYLEGA